MNLSEKQKEILEKVGITYERAGIQPAAARVLGLLYVSDNTELTFEEITETLKISKSATSNAINLLINTNQIDYTTFLGDRKRYFYLKISNWQETFAQKVEDMTKFNKVLAEVLEVRTKETEKFNRSLEDFIHFLDFINKELPGLYDKWKKSKK